MGHEGLQLIQTHEEKEKCRTVRGLFLIVKSKFKPRHNRSVISLQYQKLNRWAKSLPRNGQAGNKQRWQESEYKEYNRLLTEQFLNGPDNEGMINEILRKVSTWEGIDDATGKRVLLWAPGSWSTEGIDGSTKQHKRDQRVWLSET